MTDRGQSTNNIFIFIAGFVSAVFISSFHFIPPLVGCFIVVLALAVVAGERILHREVVREVFLISLVMLAFGFGSLRYAVKDFHIPNPAIETRVGEKFQLQGIVVSEPEKKESATRFVVSSLSERILVSTDAYNEARYGDEIIVSGKLRRPEKIDGEDGRTFNYPQYLAKDNIYYITSFAEVEILSGGHGNRIKSFLYNIKRSLVGNMRRVLSEPESSLLAGLVVSGKDALPAGIMDEFRRAGIVHIVVLSGFNISIIADFMRKFFALAFIRLRFYGLLGALSGKGPHISAGFSIAGVLAFILMTGAEATVVRAGLMVFAAIVGKLFGRTYSASRALLVAAFLMIVENPKILVFDTSFQLSFLATLALIHVSPIVERYLLRVPNKIGERTMLATTIATQILVLPYLVYAMGNLSLVSLPANILVLLIIPVTMLFGFLASVVAYASVTLAYPLTYISHLLLAWILGVSSILGNLKYSALNVSKFPFVLVILAYALLYFIWKRLQNSPPHFAN